MIASRLTSALAAAALLAVATAADKPSPIVSIATPTASVALAAMTEVGCFKTGYPLADHGEWTFQTSGNCQPICVLLQQPVMGLVNGTNCWCGDLIPPKEAKTGNDSCDTPCSGFDKENCGGPNRWWISLTGLNKNRVENADPEPSSTSTKTPAAQTTEEKSTVLVTETSSSAAPKKDNPGPNKAGIAAGVVVGVVVLAAVIAGVVLYLKHKKRREVEEEYRRQAAVNSFVAGGKLHTSNSSMTDSRLDPEFMMRRQSNGSIADNEDYSRRILKVTNA